MKDATLDLEDMQGAAADACRLMKVLSNPDCLLILCQLSQQLTVLREEALVSTRRDGKNIFTCSTARGPWRDAGFVRPVLRRTDKKP